MILLRPRTIRARLTLMTTLVMALTLAAFGFLIDFGTSRMLLGTIDADLERRGDAFAHRPRRGPRGGPEGPPPGPPGPPSVLIRPPRDRGAPGGPFGGRNDADSTRPRFIRIEPSVNEDDPPDREKPYDPQALDEALRHESHLSTVVASGEPLRVYSRVVRDEGKVRGVVQVGYPLGDVLGSLASLRRLLLTVMLPLGTLVAGLASLFLVGRMLRPLRLITEEAQKIGAEDLEGRLPVVGEDEFAGLATTLNGMLSRLQGAFRLEQATTRRLAETVEQQRRFTADASHELKTPLSTIKAHAGLLTHLTDPDDRESVSSIDDAATRMKGLVDDLLVLARADGGSLVSKVSPVDLAETASAAIGAVAPLRVEIRGAPRPLVVRGNGEALTRLFVNLLDNAKKYAGTSEPVEIRLGRRGDLAEVAVVDRGVGIAPEHLPRLFDRFYRPDDSRTSETGGTGLGLAICREIVAAHGGTIEVVSKLGEGTTFLVLLPLA